MRLGDGGGGPHRGARIGRDAHRPGHEYPSYEAETGAGKGSHVHVYIDGQEIGTLPRLKGDYTLTGLVPGGREICVRIANKAHVPTGVGSCIEVTGRLGAGGSGERVLRRGPDST